MENIIKNIHEDKNFEKLHLTEYYDQLLWYKIELNDFLSNADDKEEMKNYAEKIQDPNPQKVITNAYEEGCLTQ